MTEDGKNVCENVFILTVCNTEEVCVCVDLFTGANLGLHTFGLQQHLIQVSLSG